jgi:ABC-type microcin C transport system permease subunit YejB
MSQADQTSADAADRLSRKRVRILTAVMIVFAVQQANVSVVPPTRTVEMVGLLAWLFMAAMLLLILRTGGMLLRDPALRALANDEVTQANQAEAIEWGFFAAMAVAIGLSVVAAFTATPVLIALRLVILLGLFTATFRFVTLEKRALG